MVTIDLSSFKYTEVEKSESLQNEVLQIIRANILMNKLKKEVIA